MAIIIERFQPKAITRIFLSRRYGNRHCLDDLFLSPQRMGRCANNKCHVPRPNTRDYLGFFVLTHHPQYK